MRKTSQNLRSECPDNLYTCALELSLNFAETPYYKGGVCFSSGSELRIHSKMKVNAAGVTLRLVLFDIGGVIIDLDFGDARTTLESEYLMDSETFSELTRSGFNGEVLSVTEKAMIGAIGTDEYLMAFQNGCKRPSRI